MAALVVTVFVIGMIYLLTIWEAYAIHVLWGWFVVQQFGLPPIGMAHALGLALLVGLLTKQYSGAHEDGGSGALVYGLVGPLIALAVGWIAKACL